MAGAPATPRAINEAMAARKPGETLTVKISRNDIELELHVTLAGNVKRTFAIRQAVAPAAPQKAILEDWLRRGQ